MKFWRKFILLAICLVVSLLVLSRSFQSVTNTNQTYYPVSVMQIIDSGEVTVLEQTQPYQRVKVRVINGANKDNEFIVDFGMDQTLRKDQLLKLGDQVVLSIEQSSEGKEVLSIVDRYRLPGIQVFALVFVVLVILFAGRQGVGALIGLIVSAGIILQYIVPQILRGGEPVIVSIIGAIAMLLVTMYLAHGMKMSTTIALISTAITLFIAGVISFIAVSTLNLSGTGSEEAYLLQLGQLPNLNLRGLLLGGMILGVLGILDDVTTSQVASIVAIYQENTALTVKDLVRRGLLLGREHIASLVNTLVLAYAGVSFPLFIFFVINPLSQPLWVIMNTEFIAEEVVRTLSGSFGLVLAVPISTVLTSIAVKRMNISNSINAEHHSE